MHERVSRPPLSRRVEVPQTKHQTQFALRTTSSARIGDVIGAAAGISISVPCHSLRRSTVPCMPTIGRFGSKGPRRGGGAARSRLWEGKFSSLSASPALSEETTLGSHFRRLDPHRRRRRPTENWETGKHGGRMPCQLVVPDDRILVVSFAPETGLGIGRTIALKIEKKQRNPATNETRHRIARCNGERPEGKQGLSAFDEFDRDPRKMPEHK